MQQNFDKIMTISVTRQYRLSREVSQRLHFRAKIWSVRPASSLNMGRLVMCLKKQEQKKKAWCAEFTKLTAQSNRITTTITTNIRVAAFCMPH